MMKNHYDTVTACFRVEEANLTEALKRLVDGLKMDASSSENEQVGRGQCEKKKGVF
jgi:hypothetical protein